VGQEAVGSCTGSIGYVEITEAVDSMGVRVSPNRYGGSPYAETGCASEVGCGAKVSELTAEVFGEIDPNGVSTSYNFQYGTSTEYGNATESASAGSGWQPTGVSGTPKGLLPATKYHYRATATNGNGSSFGKDWTFETPTVAPIIEPEAPSPPPERGETVLRGRINPGGLPTNYHFEWGTAEPYSRYPAEGELEIEAGKLPVAVEAPISGLKGLTKYSHRIVASNSKGTREKGGTFETPDWRPIIGEQSVTVKPGIAVLHGMVNPNGFAATGQFQWGEATSPVLETPKPPKVLGEGLTMVPFESTVSVKGNTKYGFKTIGVNGEGTTKGSSLGFTTPDWRPGLTIDSATSVGQRRAVLRGTVNPHGFSTAYEFEYGPAESGYESVAPVEPGNAGSGEDAVPVSVSPSGLQPSTKYLYRLYASNSEGNTLSTEGSFITSTSAGLCEALESPCERPASKFGAEATEWPAWFLFSGSSAKCVNAEIYVNAAEHLAESVGFGGCSGSCSSAEALNLPYEAEFVAVGGNGKLVLSGKEEQDVQFGMYCESEQCVYSAQPLELDFSGGSPPVISGEEELSLVQSESEPGCEEEVSFEMEYHAYVPKSGYVISEPIVPGPESTVLCETKPSEEWCPEGDALGLDLEAETQEGTEVEFSKSLSGACGSSEVLLQSQGSSGDPLVGALSVLEFAECGGGVCEVEATGLPVVANLYNVGGGDGWLSGGEGGSLRLGENCSGTAIECEWELDEVNGEFSGGEPAAFWLEAAFTLIWRNSFLCGGLGSSSTVSGQYEVTQPESPLYVAEG